VIFPDYNERPAFCHVIFLSETGILSRDFPIRDRHFVTWFSYQRPAFCHVIFPDYNEIPAFCHVIFLSETGILSRDFPIRDRHFVTWFSYQRPAFCHMIFLSETGILSHDFPIRELQFCSFKTLWDNIHNTMKATIFLRMCLAVNIQFKVKQNLHLYYNCIFIQVTLDNSKFRKPWKYF
jgi:hypothetical protein